MTRSSPHVGPAPNWNSPQAAAFASFSTTTGSARQLEVGLQVEVAPGQVRCERHDGDLVMYLAALTLTLRGGGCSLVTTPMASSIAGTSVAGDST